MAIDPSDITFRPLGPDDLPILCDWVNRMHLAQWWDSLARAESTSSSPTAHG